VQPLLEGCPAQGRRLQEFLRFIHVGLLCVTPFAAGSAVAVRDQSESRSRESRAGRRKSSSPFSISVIIIIMVLLQRTQAYKSRDTMVWAHMSYKLI
jgi:hypothetical protein